MSARHHHERSLHIQATPEEVFRRLDDHVELASHMTNSSWMMGGRKMALEFDSALGKAVGAKMAMRGNIFGLELALEQVVTERQPPSRKSWQTVGSPRLLVIGGYRMGFEIQPAGAGSRITIFIDYEDPPRPLRWLGRLLGPAYARWCVRSMLEGAARALASGRPEQSTATRKELMPD